jgi:hypothetical protein
MTLTANSRDRPTPCRDINWIAGGDAGETCGGTDVSPTGDCPRCGNHRAEYDHETAPTNGTALP